MTFVGREHDLGRLGVALEQASGGRLTRVVLTGPTGVGVTRLLGELEQRLSGEPDLLIVRGTAYPPLAGQPFAPLAAALRGPFASMDGPRLAEMAGPAGEQLAALMPDLAPRLRAAGALPVTSLRPAEHERSNHMLEALLGILERLGGGGVVLLGLDDLQWADPGTHAFVRAVARITRPLRLCVVAAYHPDELDRHHPFGPLARELREGGTFESVALEPFSRAELAELIEATSGERPSAGVLAAVAERSGGIPLLAAQSLAASRTVPALRLSDPFEELLEARVAQLNDAAVRCLRVLAALRRPLPATHLLELEQGGTRLSSAGLRDALASGLAVAVPEGIVIAHPRYAEAVESFLDPVERHDLHATLAERLDASPAEQAWHLEAALELAAAGHAHLAAGNAANALDPGPTALAEYLRALEIAPAPPDAPVGPGTARTRPAARARPTARARSEHLAERARLLARAAQAAFVAGSFRRAATLVMEAIDGLAAAGARARLADGPADRSATAAGHGAGSGAGSAAAREARALEIALLYEHLGRYRHAAGEQDAAMAAFRTAAELAPPKFSAGRARILASLAQALMIEAHYAESSRIAQEAIDLARGLGTAAQAELGHATCTLGVDLAYQGDFAAGLELVRGAAVIARQAGRLDDLMRAYANLTTLLDLDVRRDEALAVMEEGIAEAARWGQAATYGAFLRGNAADCLYTLGRWKESEAMCRRALEWSPTGQDWFDPLVGLALVRVESAADEDAGRVLGQLLLRLEHAPDAQWSANVQRASVSYALWRDDLVDAERSATRDWQRVLGTDEWRQIAMAATTTVEVLAAVAEDARRRRDPSGVGSAAELADRVIAEAEQRVAASGVPETLGARREADLYLATARAHRDRLQGRAVPEAWGQIAVAWLAFPVPYNAARARRWEAEAALLTRPGPRARADRGRARRALADAWRLASQLGARPLQRELLQLADRARIRAPGVPPVEVALEAPVPGTGAPPRAAAAERAAAPASGGGATVPDAPGGLRQRLLPSERRPSPLFNLSPRELEVLRILSEGRTNREIARRLYISERTVAIHVGNILAKLRVSGRVEAATLAFRLGLAAVPPGRAGRTLRRPVETE